MPYINPHLTDRRTDRRPDTDRRLAVAITRSVRSNAR